MKDLYMINTIYDRQKFNTGETIRYWIRYRADKHSPTEYEGYAAYFETSSVAMMFNQGYVPFYSGDNNA